MDGIFSYFFKRTVELLLDKISTFLHFIIHNSSYRKITRNNAGSDFSPRLSMISKLLIYH